LPIGVRGVTLTNNHALDIAAVLRNDLGLLFLVTVCEHSTHSISA
jgi:hypothetical protein